MNGFHTKFDKLLADIAEIKIDAAEGKAETRILSARLNGTVDNMNRHLDETEDRKKALNTLWVTIMVQIIGFAFMSGGLIWMVNNDNHRIKIIEQACGFFKDHVVKDEARWEIFKIPECKTTILNRQEGGISE